MKGVGARLVKHGRGRYVAGRDTYMVKRSEPMDPSRLDISKQSPAVAPRFDDKQIARPGESGSSSSSSSSFTAGPVYMGPGSLLGATTANKGMVMLDKSGHTVTGRTTIKRFLERKTRPAKYVHLYLHANKLGKPRTQPERKELWFELTQNTFAPKFMDQMKPRMNLVASAVKEDQLPLPRKPEVAFIGRSNTGKSTLLNGLTGRLGYCFVKRTPGSTQELNFWNIGKPAMLCLVDMPGYGFAMANEERRVQWTEFTLWYIKHRANLKLMMLLIDARHGFFDSDREFASFLERNGIPWRIILTKTDLVPTKMLAKRMTILNRFELEFDPTTKKSKKYRFMQGPPIPVSAAKRQNLEAVREVLEKFALPKPMVVDGIRQNCFDLIDLERQRRKDRAGRRAERVKARLAQGRVEKLAKMTQREVSSTLANWGISEEEVGAAEDGAGVDRADAGGAVGAASWSEEDEGEEMLIDGVECGAVDEELGAREEEDEDSAGDEEDLVSEGVDLAGGDAALRAAALAYSKRFFGVEEDLVSKRGTGAVVVPEPLELVEEKSPSLQQEKFEILQKQCESSSSFADDEDEELLLSGPSDTNSDEDHVHEEEQWAAGVPPPEGEEIEETTEFAGLDNVNAFEMPALIKPKKKFAERKRERDSRREAVVHAPSEGGNNSSSRLPSLEDLVMNGGVDPTTVQQSVEDGSTASPDQIDRRSKKRSRKISQAQNNVASVDKQRGLIQLERDRQLTDDEVVTEDDANSAWKKGKMDFDLSSRTIADNKEKYTNEWRTKLDNLEMEQEDVEDLPVLGPRAANNPTKYATTIGLHSPALGTPIPKGIHKWRYLGRSRFFDRDKSVPEV